MKTFTRTFAHFGRTITVAATIAASMATPAHGLAPGESMALSGRSGLTGPFTHAYGFSLASAAGIDYFSSRINFPTSFSITGFAATPFSGTTAIIPGIDGVPTRMLVPNSFFLGSLGPGTYRLEVGGLAA